MSLADQIAEAYRAGDYGQVQNWINSSGATANDIQSQFGLNAADMSWLTNNIGLDIPSAPAPVAYAPPPPPAPMPVPPRLPGGGNTPGLPMPSGSTGGFDTNALQSWLNSNGYTRGGTPAPTTGGGNPYLSGAADDITRRFGQLQSQGLQAVRSNAIGNLGLGGSRQGIAEANVINTGTDNLAGQLTGMYGQDWNNSQNRELQRYGMDQGFYTAQRGQDLAQIGLGSQLDTQALQNQWYPLQQYAGIIGNLSGQNTSTTNSSQTGGGAAGAIGGLLGSTQLGRNLGWW